MSTCVKKPDVLIETIHGVPVADPYRWLEDRDTPATAAWLGTQRQRFRSYFEKLDDLGPLRTRVKAFLDVESIDQIGMVRDKYFYRKRLVGKQQPVICVMDAETRQERVLFDPRALGPFASAGIFRLSKDARLLAFELKHGGEHSKAIHIADVFTGKVLPDRLGRGLARGMVFRECGNGFYYCHDILRDDVRDSGENHSIYFHRFGSCRSEDELLLTLPRSAGSKLVLGGDDEMLSAAYYRKTADHYRLDFYVSSQERHGVWQCIARDIAAPFNPFFCGRMLLVVSHEGAPNGEIVELNIKNGNRERVIVPQWQSLIRHVAVVKDRAYITYLSGTETVVRIWSLAGEYIGFLPLERGRTWTVLPPHSSQADEVFLSCESFTRPPTLYSLDPSSGSRRLFAQPRVPALSPSIVCRRVSFAAADGTLIWMSLVGPSGTEPRNVPVIMTAYGGFGVSVTPQFSVFVSILLELGFFFALPEIRGGGEQGREWHVAAQGRNRQVAFDDFLAAAEWMCREGITHPDKLAIFGGSNSGLLAGAVVTQRPDLFRAALCVAPLLDMVRYHLFDRAYIWAEEYGTAADAADFHALHSYSPYHRVEETQNYPSVLFVSGDKDTRCNPAHARKMVARLQERAAQQNPVLLDYSPERGHAATMPLDVRIEALTQRIAFICCELGTENHPARCPASLMFRSLGYLLRTEWHLQRYPNRPLQSTLKRFPVADRKPQRPSARLISHAMNIACVLYCKDVKCLQRSVALAMVLREHGFPAEVVIGGQVAPPRFHAWVELQHTVLNDKPYTPQLYRELHRC